MTVTPNRIWIPDLCLVVLVGASGSGKSTFAARHFRSTEVLGSDSFRAMVADDETDQSATTDAFAALHFVAGRRLAAGRLTVVDATNVQREVRQELVALARKHHVVPVAIVLDVPERVCIGRNAGREFGPGVVVRQVRQLRRSLKGMRREGFGHVFVLSSQDEVSAAPVERRPLYCDRRDLTGPFDIVGDVHGCCDETEELLERLGYARGDWVHPDGRTLVFLGDLVDRGPRILDTLRLVMAMAADGRALCVPGNHDVRLVRKLRGRDVRITYGLDRSLSELEAIDDAERTKIAEFLDGLVSHYVLDGGALVVAHAGMRQEMQGRGSGKVRDFALYGETTGETDEFGLPVRYEWARDYRGRARVVYGHTPVPEPEWLNRTINIDTGCVFGGRLTALRYPELDLVSVSAHRVWCEPVKPLDVPSADGLSAQHADDQMLDIEDVLGKRIVRTGLAGNVTVREENAVAALEVMARFAIDPRWLVYLPPTMSPCETSRRPGLLEHPAEAFAFYRTNGVEKVVCEEKHMGSRAVVVACRDEAAARRRFGGVSEVGACYTRTGRRFFLDRGLESEVLSRVVAACDRAGLWDELATEWVVLDCEVMPWSAKADGLIRRQYASVAAAGHAGLQDSLEALSHAASSGVDVSELTTRIATRAEMVDAYAEAYGRYCWPVTRVDDLKVAAFHVLAAEGNVWLRRDHGWHMDFASRLADADRDVLTSTDHLAVDTTQPEDEAAAAAWWGAMTERGAEGMVVKPFEFPERGLRGLVQPALKCRGREYLRIIYGPEYSSPEHLERLRHRSLGAKRSLAVREFALGVEALDRFVAREPLRRVHECVFGVLALESEPVDPRL